MKTDIRHCKQCTQDLPISAFGKNRSRKDGLTFYCKTCNSQNYKTWRESVRGTDADERLRRQSLTANRRFRENHPTRDREYLQ